jgi:hypothetical protein
MVWYYGISIVLQFSKQRFKLAYDILDETICAHITTLNIHKILGLLKSIPQNRFAHEPTFNSFEL